MNRFLKDNIKMLSCLYSNYDFNAVDEEMLKKINIFQYYAYNITSSLDLTDPLSVACGKTKAFDYNPFNATESDEYFKKQLAYDTQLLLNDFSAYKNEHDKKTILPQETIMLRKALVTYFEIMDGKKKEDYLKAMKSYILNNLEEEKEIVKFVEKRLAFFKSAIDFHKAEHKNQKNELKRLREEKYIKKFQSLLNEDEDYLKYANAIFSTSKHELFSEK